MIDERIRFLMVDHQQPVPLLPDEHGGIAVARQEIVRITQVDADGAGRRLQYLLVNEARQVVDEGFFHQTKFYSIFRRDKLQVASYKLQVTSYKLQVASCKLQVASYK